MTDPSGTRRAGSGDRPTVAVLLSERATVIDFCGPWEVFQDAGYRLCTVAETLDVLHASGGMKILPEHTYADAPKAAIVVVGAQETRSPATLDWLRSRHAEGSILMSVCTGAFLLAETGLLDGKLATTHHLFYDKFAAEYPKVGLRRHVRFVDHGDLVCASGLTAGIDLALHMVSRFDGEARAAQVAGYMEHRGDGWRSASSAEIGHDMAQDTAQAVAG
jgi:transcriptional regulator GlxA family with amidase domain